MAFLRYNRYQDVKLSRPPKEKEMRDKQWQIQHTLKTQRDSIAYTVNHLYTDTRCKDKIRYIDNLTVGHTFTTLCG